MNHFMKCIYVFGNVVLEKQRQNNADRYKWISFSWFYLNEQIQKQVTLSEVPHVIGNDGTKRVNASTTA